MNERATHKPLFWVGSSLDDLREFPNGVKRIMGFALGLAQGGEAEGDNG
jgi:phage-related protein